MNEECPCCYFTTYKKHYDHSGEHLEPTTGYCESCGFQYSEHIKISEREQAVLYRLELRQLGRALNWKEIFECDKVSGYFKTEKRDRINLRINDKYPHHSKITVFVNGTNCGDLCLRIEEYYTLFELLALGNFHYPLADLHISTG